MIDSNNKLKSLSKAVLESAKQIIVEARAKTNSDLAKKAPPYDKVTHADVLVGRGVYSHSDVVKHKAKKGMKEDADVVVIHAPVLGDIHGELAEVLKRDPRDKTVHVQCEGMKYILKTGQYRELDEAVKNPYAVGMAAAIKSTGDTPPLKKSTITKAHEIAKKVAEEVEIDEAYTISSKGHNNVHVMHKGKTIAKFSDPQSARMHIAKLNKQKTNEEVEDLDESKTHYMSGFNSEKAGKQRKHNPFKEGSPAAHYWAKGWEHSNDGKQPQKFVNEGVENIDELSTDKVKAYASRAFDQANSIIKTRDRDLPKSVKKAAEDAKERRRKGIVSAGKRLGKDEMQKVATASANKIREDVEDLDELSKGTLASYTKKAIGSMRSLEDQSDRMHKKGHDSYKAGATKTSDAQLNRSDKLLKKSGKRGEGINTAINKLAKEEVENIAELSRKTLASYTNKAADSMARKHAETVQARNDYDSASSIDHSTSGTPSRVRDAAKSIIRNDAMDRENKARGTVGKRFKGIQRATSRLAKEDVEFTQEEIDFIEATMSDLD